MDSTIDEPLNSILSFGFFDYFLKCNKIKYQKQNEYTTEPDNFNWDICQRLNHDYLLGKKTLIVESIDVELLKITFATIESFSGNLVFQSYKGNYLTPNNKIFEMIIKSCPHLKYFELNNLNSIKNNDKLVINLDVLINSSLENLIIKSSNQIMEANLVIEFGFNHNPKRKINIKINVDNKLLNLLSNKYNEYQIFFYKLNI